MTLIERGLWIFIIWCRWLSSQILYLRATFFNAVCQTRVWLIYLAFWIDIRKPCQNVYNDVWLSSLLIVMLYLQQQNLNMHHFVLELILFPWFVKMWLLIKTALSWKNVAHFSICHSLRVHVVVHQLAC